MKQHHPPQPSWSNYLWFNLVGVGTFICVLVVPSFAHGHFEGKPPQRYLSHQHAGLASDHQNLGGDHIQINQKLDGMLEFMKNMTNNSPVPLCGAGTDAQRFVPIGENSICDNATGLYWEQSPSTLTFTQDNALAHCSGLGEGHHLPGIKELGTLLDYSVGDQSTLLNAGPFEGVLSVRYWTATPSANMASMHWTINFFNADSGEALSGATFPAWCVR